MIPIRDDNSTRTTPFITWFLMALCIASFVYQLALPEAEIVPFVYRWGVVPARLWSWQDSAMAEVPSLILLPFLTHMFLHGSWLHLIGNVWSLWLFGDDIEDRLGHMRFLLFYLVTGLLAVLLHCLFSLGSPVPTIGASGAIAGVMGAYFLLYPFAWITVVVPVLFIPLFVKLPAAVYLLIWIAFQVAGSWGTLTAGRPAGGGIAFLAHLGGFAAGVFLIRRWGIRRRKRLRAVL